MAGHDGGEWSQVKRKGGRLRNLPAPGGNGADSLEDGIRPNPNPELSADDVWRYHQSVADPDDGQTSEWWQSLRQLLEEALNQPDSPVITQAVCLGPGPYEPSNGSSKARRTAHMQTAAFCFIVERLKSCGHRDIRCVVQEPRFTQTDENFCAKLGLEAVESPDAFSLVDGTTLLFGIHMELDIYNRALEILPGIYIGAGLDEWEKVVVNDGASSTNSLAAFSRMHAAYKQYAFPDLDHMFSSTTMYVRRQDT